MYEEPQVIDIDAEPPLWRADPDKYVAAVVARREAELEAKREKKLERQRVCAGNWRAKNPGAAAKASRAWKQRNPEQRYAAQIAWKNKNPGKIREYSRRAAAAKRERALNDPEFAARRRERGRDYYARNAERIKARTAEYQKEHKTDIKRAREARESADPGKYRGKYLTRHYGISLSDWNKLFEGQGKCCAICKSKTPRWRRGWATDHCHETGEVRGILCHICNMGIAKLGEDVKVLKAAIEYLEEPPWRSLKN